MPNSTELLSGGVLTPNISEYISRVCRKQLLNLALQVVGEEHKELHMFNERNGVRLSRRGGWNIGPIGLLAKRLDLHRMTIREWIENEERHPCNENIEKIVNLLIDKYSNELFKLLEEDLFTHQYALGLLRDRAANHVYPIAVRGGTYTKKQRVVA